MGGALRVETWQNGATDLKMPTFCTPDYDYDVQNVSMVSMPDGVSWKETQDHSKWGVTDSSSKRTACVGDINRQYSQESRGGGAVCYDNSDHWSSFNSIVA